MSSGLIHRVEFIYKLVLGYDLLLFTTFPQSSRLGITIIIILMYLLYIYINLDIDDKHKILNNPNVQIMVYQFTIFNPTVKIYPACHVPILSSQRHKVKLNKIKINVLLIGNFFFITEKSKKLFETI